MNVLLHNLNDSDLIFLAHLIAEACDLDPLKLQVCRRIAEHEAWSAEQLLTVQTPPDSRVQNHVSAKEWLCGLRDSQDSQDMSIWMNFINKNTSLQSSLYVSGKSSWLAAPPSLSVLLNHLDDITTQLKKK